MNCKAFNNTLKILVVFLHFIERLYVNILILMKYFILFYVLESTIFWHYQLPFYLLKYWAVFLKENGHTLRRQRSEMVDYFHRWVLMSVILLPILNWLLKFPCYSHFVSSFMPFSNTKQCYLYYKPKEQVTSLGKIIQEIPIEFISDVCLFKYFL